MTKTLALIMAACATMATLPQASAMDGGWRPAPRPQSLRDTRPPPPWVHRFPVNTRLPGKIQHTCYNIAGRPYQTTMHPCPIS